MFQFYETVQKQVCAAGHVPANLERAPSSFCTSWKFPGAVAMFLHSRLQFSNSLHNMWRWKRSGKSMQICTLPLSVPCSFYTQLSLLCNLSEVWIKKHNADTWKCSYVLLKCAGDAGQIVPSIYFSGLPVYLLMAVFFSFLLQWSQNMSSQFTFAKQSPALRPS